MRLFSDILYAFVGFTCFSTLRPTVGPNDEYGGGFGGPGTGFCNCGGSFRVHNSSGKPLGRLRQNKSPGQQKQVSGPPGPPPYSLLGTSLRLLRFSEHLEPPSSVKPARAKHVFGSLILVVIVACHYLTRRPLPFSSLKPSIGAQKQEQGPRGPAL